MIDKLTTWLSEKFQHPLSLLFFIFGGFLIILGVSTGLSIPSLNQVLVDPAFRWTTIAIGSIFCVLSIIIYYRPPASEARSASEDESIPPEMLLNFVGKQAAMSKSQRAILGFLIDQSYPDKAVSQDMVEAQFNNINRSHLFYRLEHLRLLRFIDRRKVGEHEGMPRYCYQLSEIYKKEINQANVNNVRKGSI